MGRGSGPVERLPVSTPRGAEHAQITDTEVIANHLLPYWLVRVRRRNWNDTQTVRICVADWGVALGPADGPLCFLDERGSGTCGDDPCSHGALSEVLLDRHPALRAERVWRLARAAGAAAVSLRADGHARQVCVLADGLHIVRASTGETACLSDYRTCRVHAAADGCCAPLMVRSPVLRDIPPLLTDRGATFERIRSTLLRGGIHPFFQPARWPALLYAGSSGTVSGTLLLQAASDHGLPLFTHGRSRKVCGVCDPDPSAVCPHTELRDFLGALTAKRGRSAR